MGVHRALTGKSTLPSQPHPLLPPRERGRREEGSGWRCPRSRGRQKQGRGRLQGLEARPPSSRLRSASHPLCNQPPTTAAGSRTHHAFAHVVLALARREKGPQGRHEVWASAWGLGGPRCPPAPSALPRSRAHARLCEAPAAARTPASALPGGAPRSWAAGQAARSRCLKWGPPALPSLPE